MLSPDLSACTIKVSMHLGMFFAKRNEILAGDIRYDDVICRRLVAELLLVFVNHACADISHHRAVPLNASVSSWRCGRNRCSHGYLLEEILYRDASVITSVNLGRKLLLCN